MRDVCTQVQSELETIAHGPGHMAGNWMIAAWKCHQYIAVGCVHCEGFEEYTCTNLLTCYDEETIEHETERFMHWLRQSTDLELGGI